MTTDTCQTPGTDTLSGKLPPDALARLDADILRWHDQGRVDELAMGYRAGAHHALACGNRDAACFLMTQAYVFALRAGLLDIADELWAGLKAHGREA